MDRKSGACGVRCCNYIYSFPRLLRSDVCMRMPFAVGGSGRILQHTRSGIPALPMVFHRDRRRAGGMGNDSWPAKRDQSMAAPVLSSAAGGFGVTRLSGSGRHPRRGDRDANWLLVVMHCLGSAGLQWLFGWAILNCTSQYEFFRSHAAAVRVDRSLDCAQLEWWYGDWFTGSGSYPALTWCKCPE
jgi:hypothetical protein